MLSAWLKPLYRAWIWQSFGECSRETDLTIGLTAPFRAYAWFPANRIGCRIVHVANPHPVDQLATAATSNSRLERTCLPQTRARATLPDVHRQVARAHRSGRSPAHQSCGK